ncbi:MAG: methyltransferase family protein [Desulfobaccales bacterium]
MPRFELGLGNAWLLSLPFLILVTFMVGMKKDLIKRMSEMSGYTAREKFFTVSASISPYPFIIATFWVPFSSIPLLIFFGLLINILGLSLCAASLRVIIKTPPEELFSAGPYRFSRNPMYVSSTIVFMGICLATANLVLSGYLAIAVLLQHFMILAEERICKEKYGVAFEGYLRQVPRYLFIV